MAALGVAGIADEDSAAAPAGAGAGKERVVDADVARVREAPAGSAAGERMEAAAAQRDGGGESAGAGEAEGEGEGEEELVFDAVEAYLEERALRRDALLAMGAGEHLGPRQVEGLLDKPDLMWTYEHGEGGRVVGQKEGRTPAVGCASRCWCPCVWGGASGE